MWDGVRVIQNGVRVWVWGVVCVGWGEGHSGSGEGVGVGCSFRGMGRGSFWRAAGGRRGGESVGWAEGRGKERGVTTTNPHPSLPTVLSRYTEQYQHPEINRFIPVVAELALEEAVYIPPSWFKNALLTPPLTSAAPYSASKRCYLLMTVVHRKVTN